ncbi:hypothetical protein L6164_020974 [Bauhinia variegata]|uniref:Uncharacterized protein n=1 Tax=Bauhinia variegata TaxID=167791 RepID=A0ACB9MY18_BAUVA|nr:hypothetical protein L6164_020974 [Bauhinia variegata]
MAAVRSRLQKLTVERLNGENLKPVEENPESKKAEFLLAKRTPASLPQLPGKKELRLETMDRLSDLPKHILHNILSRMPLRDRVRTSVLSKTWNHTCSTFPILDFSQDRYVQLDNPENIEDVERERNNFINHVDKTLTRFHNQGLAIRELKLRMRYSDSQSIHSLFDYWMRLAVESGVQVLDLGQRICGNGSAENYCLPPCILEAKSLTKLNLFGSIRVDHAFMNNPIQFSSLQVLSLWFVSLGGEQIIQNIISSCPLIEHLTLYQCGELKSLRIQGLHRLKRVMTSHINEIDIDAPNLEVFWYEQDPDGAPFNINLDKCRNLRGLYLLSVRPIIISDKWLLELFHKFPLLERLKLDDCWFSERIKISSALLKNLELEIRKCANLKEVIIDAPNLCSLRFYSPYKMPILSIFKSSSVLQINVNLKLTVYWDFQKLREFLQSFEQRDILATLSLEIDLLSEEEFNLEELRDIPVSPPCIKHMDLNIYSQTPVLHLVTSLLWSCCPATISIPLLNRTCYSVVKVLEEMLTGRKLDECYCNSSDIKCWWHGLKDVKVTRTLENVGSAYPAGVATVTFQLEY